MIDAYLSQAALENNKKTEIQNKIATMKAMHGSGDYVNSLRAGSAIAKELDSYEKPEDNGLILLGITSLAILAAIGAYILKQQKPKKEFKKLRKITDF
jgi:hypothetical protein